MPDIQRYKPIRPNPQLIHDKCHVTLLTFVTNQIFPRITYFHHCLRTFIYQTKRLVINQPFLYIRYTYFTCSVYLFSLLNSLIKTQLRNVRQIR